MLTSAALSYFVVMIDYGRKGRESITDPEITRQDVIDRVRSGEYDRIAFIHQVEIDENGRGTVSDVTNEILAAADFYAEVA